MKLCLKKNDRRGDDEPLNPPSGYGLGRELNKKNK